ncbi:MAG: Ldh family oxidoreductase [Clostridiales bacterium]|nr:Ldh family oxidoreductase [Clostridiales bacterium]
MAYITIDSLRKTTNELLETWGVPRCQAEIITDTIVYAHTHEKHTHGITRMPIYKKKIEEGNMSAETTLERKVDLPSLTVLRCNNGFGQVAACQGMKICIEKARSTGMAAVFISDSNNFGVAGYFGEMAAREGMVGIVITASGPAIAPMGGEKAIFGTNPVCFAFPASEENIILDMAITEAARGKIRLAEKNGEKIPTNWAVDKEGNPTDDPAKALEGTMLAIGGVKGFGLAMSFDILAGLMSGSAFGGNIKTLAASDGPSRHGHMLVAIDLRQMMSPEEYNRKISELISNVKLCGKPGAIMMPGERSAAKARKNRETVLLDDRQIRNYNQLAADCLISNQLVSVKAGKTQHGT